MTNRSKIWHSKPKERTSRGESFQTVKSEIFLETSNIVQISEKTLISNEPYK